MKEPIKNEGLILRSNANPKVLHLEMQARAFSLDGHPDQALVRGVFDGVFQETIQHILKDPFFDAKDEIPCSFNTKTEIPVRGPLLCPLHGLCRDGEQGEVLHRGLLIDADHLVRFLLDVQDSI